VERTLNSARSWSLPAQSLHADRAVHACAGPLRLPLNH